MIISTDCKNCKFYNLCNMKLKYKKYINALNEIKPSTTYFITVVKCQEFLRRNNNEE